MNTFLRTLSVKHPIEYFKHIPLFILLQYTYQKLRSICNKNEAYDQKRKHVCTILLYTTHFLFLSSIPWVWKRNPLRFFDIVVYLSMLGVLSITTWLSHREIEHTILAKNAYIQELKQEQGRLEKRVTERTKELEEINVSLYQTFLHFQQAQKERFVQIENLVALGKITTGLIHDIVNPLMYASITVDVERKREQKYLSLKDKKNSSEHHQNLEMIYDGLQEITRLIESTRKQVRQQSEVTMFSIAKEIQLACRFLRYQAYEKHITYVFSIDPSLCIYGDAAKFHQCISNIVINAIEAYPPTKNHGEIRIGATKKSHSIFITIQDFAGGIPHHLQQYLFTPFFTTKSLDKGTGVGLCVVKDTIEQFFHGTITFHSTEHEGTTFEIIIPNLRKTPTRLLAQSEYKCL